MGRLLGEVRDLRRELASIKSENSELAAERDRLLALMAPPPAPTVFDLIPWSDLRDLYLDIFPDGRDKMFFGDLEYGITAISEIRRFVEWDNTDEKGYTIWEKDCEDFTNDLSGSFARHHPWSKYPVAEMWGTFLGNHAILTVVAWPSFEDRTPRVFHIEPQNDWEIAYESVEGSTLLLLKFT